jgi:hypothetical protein
MTRPLSARRIRSLAGLFVASAAMLVASCMQISPADAPERCRHIAQYPCLTPRVCTFDSAGGCQVCRCGPPAYVPPSNIDPRPSAP